MTKLDLYNLDGTTTEKIDAPSIFSVEPKKPLLHQAVVAYLANQRQSNASTKTRGLVAGGGRKPWKQKGTGRARAGSSRSPLWIGGGITFGPLSTDNYKKRLPAKMKQMALAMALSAKVAANDVRVVKTLTVAEPKTKLAFELFNRLAPDAPSLLIIVATAEPKLLQAAQNLPNVSIMTVSDLHTYAVLRFQKIIMTEEAMQKAQTLLGQPEKK